MNRNIVIEALIRTTLWGVEHRFNQLRRALVSLVRRGGKAEGAS